jgi:hypothetical protein
VRRDAGDHGGAERLGVDPAGLDAQVDQGANDDAHESRGSADVGLAARPRAERGEVADRQAPDRVEVGAEAVAGLRMGVADVDLRVRQPLEEASGLACERVLGP